MTLNHTFDAECWGLVLGGSSGFGLATAEKMARHGMNLVIAHKDSASAVTQTIGPQFESLRSHEVKIVTFNGNLLDEDERADLFDLIREHVPKRSLKLILHSIAAGACKPLVPPQWDSHRGKAIDALCARLSSSSAKIAPGDLRQAINDAFHVDGCDALYTLADSQQPAAESTLTEEDFANTNFLMGYDLALWARELHVEELTARPTRVVGLTSEGNQRAWIGYAAVSAAKVALEATARSMAVELGPLGILTCIIQAGVTDTQAGNAIPYFDLIKAQSRLRNPLGRLTQVDDVADAIFALTQSSFNFVNGSIIQIDGGESISAG